MDLLAVGLLGVRGGSETLLSTRSCGATQWSRRASEPWMPSGLSTEVSPPLPEAVFRPEVRRARGRVILAPDHFRLIEAAPA